MNSRLPLLALVGLLGAAAAHAQAPVTDATVVAKVASQNITRGQLHAQLLKYYARGGVQQLVNRSVMRQEAARLKVEVPETSVTTRLAEFKKAGGADLPAAIEAQGINDEVLRDRLRADLLAEGVLDKKWPVRDSDLIRLSVRYARVQTERDARGIIQEASLSKGRNFELLVRQRSMDRENDGLVQPDPFLRIDNPAWFKIAEDVIRAQSLAVGQITRKPVESKQFWLVIRLEKYLPADTLKGAERDRVVQRIRAVRMPALVPTSRKRYKIEQPVTAAQLVSDTGMAAGAVVAKVTPAAGGEGAEITRQALMRYLLETYGKTALDQLVERAMITQMASKVGASVSDAEVADRVAVIKKGTGEKAFQEALDLEGITESAWTERVRYTFLAEKTVNTRAPLTQNDLVRMTARYIRVGSKEDAEPLIRAAQGTTPFDTIAKQRSLDRSSDHFIKPRFFLRAEQPEIFQALSTVTPGQVLTRPVEIAGSFYVLKLEARFGPETLSAKEREDAVRRINTLRMGPLLDTWRKEIKVEYPVSMKTLLAGARA